MAKKIIALLLLLFISLRIYSRSIDWRGSKRASGAKYNNMGNIRPSPRKFDGEAGTFTSSASGNFRVFKTYYHGAKAQLKLLRDVYFSGGKTSIEKILYKYAPPADNNNTENYISFVSRESGINRSEMFSFSDREKVLRMVKAIVWHETGHKEYYLPLPYSVAYTDLLLGI